MSNASHSTAVGVPQWTIADRLRKARESRGWKQADLMRASDGDLTLRTISNYESESYESDRQRKTVRRWAMVCGVPFDWLWEGVVPSDDGPDDEGVAPLSTKWQSNVRPLRPATVPPKIAA